MTEDVDRAALLALLRAEAAMDALPETWESVAHLAQQHRLEPLLYRQLKTLGLTQQAPADVVQALHSAYLRTAYRNLRLYREVRDLFQRLNAANVEGILLKGAYLADRVYGNIAVRPMSDVDVLVQKNDLSRVSSIMREAGYRRINHLHQTTNETHHFGWKNHASDLYIEIHWDLIDAAYGIHVDIGELWGRSHPAIVADIPVREMSPEDQILHLCVHASTHVFGIGLLSQCDLAETLVHSQQTIDWESVRQRARLWNAQRCAYLNLCLVKELLNSPIPEELLESLRPADFDPRFLTLAQAHLFASQEEIEDALPQSRNFARFWAEETAARKLMLFWRNILPPRQAMATMYPAPPGSLRILFYYPVRLMDLLRKQGHVAWLLFRGDPQMRLRAEQQRRVNALRDWLLGVE